MFDSDKGLVVRNKFIENFMKQNPDFYDADYSFFNAQDDYLITPETIYKQRIMYKVIEYEQLIDSCNINVEKWSKIANTIKENYDNFDSFIILHGTDTMAYTGI